MKKKKTHRRKSVFVILIASTGVTAFAPVKHLLSLSRRPLSPKNSPWRKIEISCPFLVRSSTLPAKK
jgi:hypothetical protein